MEFRKILLILVILSAVVYADEFGQCVANGRTYNCMTTFQCTLIGNPQGGCEFYTQNPNDPVVCCVTSQPLQNPSVSQPSQTSSQISCSNLPSDLETGYNQYADIIQSASAQYGVDKTLIAAIISQESRWNSRAVGDSGNSLGLMQINIRAHPECNADKIRAFDAEENIICGTNFLATIARTRNIETPRTYSCRNVQYSDVQAVMRWYNGWPSSGSNACAGDPNYVDRVNTYYEQWSSCLGSSTSSQNPSSGVPRTYGRCDAPWENYYCNLLSAEGTCPQADYTPLPYMCPSQPNNNVQCCIPTVDLESAQNVYGNCQGKEFNQYACARVTRRGSSYYCPQTGYSPISRICGGTSNIQCCVPDDVIRQSYQSGDFTQCKPPYDNYQCTSFDQCDATENVAYGGFCYAENTVCCIPKSDHVQKFYVYDNANVIDAAKERVINSILETLDNEEQFVYDYQTKAPVMIQTESNNAIITSDFIKYRYEELTLDKTNPSALLLLNTNVVNVDGEVRHILYVYSSNKNFERALRLIVTSHEDLLQANDFNEFSHKISADIQRYVIARSIILKAARDFAEKENCDKFQELMVAAVSNAAIGQYQMDDATVASILEQVIEDTQKTCLNVWKKGVQSELQDEISKLDKAVQISSAETNFDTSDPSCEPNQENMYACVSSPDGSFDLRRCVNKRFYATSTEVGINAGEFCLSPAPASDDYFDLTNGQVRCAKDANGFSLVQCRTPADPQPTWTRLNPNVYDTQDSCAIACNGLAQNSRYCTEPRINSYASGINGNVLRDGQTVPWSNIKIVSNRQQVNPIQLDRNVRHTIKYKILNNGATVYEYATQSECISASPDNTGSLYSNYCELLIDQNQLRTGYEVQYWSEISFIETNGETTYIRSPATGVHSFFIEGTAPSQNTQAPLGETFFEWESISDKIDLNTCRAACQSKDGCLETQVTDEGTANVLQAFNGWTTRAELENEKRFLTQVVACYAGSPDIQNALAACVEELAPETNAVFEASEAISGRAVFPNKYFADTNARLLLLRSVEGRLSEYHADPRMTVCNAAWENAAILEAIMTPYVPVTGTSISVPWNVIDSQRVRNAYSLVIEKCQGINNIVATANAAVALDKIKTVRDPFSKGVSNVFVSFAEPSNLKVMGGLVAVTLITRFLPGAGDVVAAARWAAARHALYAVLESYFVVEMSIGLKESIPKCHAAGIDTAECGEAMTQALMLLTLTRSVGHNSVASFKLLSKSEQFAELSAIRARLITELQRNQIAINRLNGFVREIDGSEFFPGTGLWDNSIAADQFRLSGLGKDAATLSPAETRALVDSIGRRQLDVSDLEAENFRKTEEIKKIDDRHINLLLELIETDSVISRTGIGRSQVFILEMKKVIEERKRNGRSIACPTGLVTGFAACGPNADFGEELARVAQESLDDIRKVDSGKPAVLLSAADMRPELKAIIKSEKIAIVRTFNDIINNDQVQVARGADYISRVRDARDFVDLELDRIRLQVDNEPALDFTQRSAIATSEIENLIERVTGEAPTEAITKLNNLKDRIANENIIRSEIAEAEAQSVLNEPVTARPRIESDPASTATRTNLRNFRFEFGPMDGASSRTKIIVSDLLSRDSAVLESVIRKNIENQVRSGNLEQSFSDYVEHIENARRSNPDSVYYSIEYAGSGATKDVVSVNLQGTGVEFVVKVPHFGKELGLDAEINVLRSSRGRALMEEGVLPEFIDRFEIDFQGKTVPVQVDRYVRHTSLSDVKTRLAEFEPRLPDIEKGYGRLVGKYLDATYDAQTGKVFRLADTNPDNFVILKDATGNMIFTETGFADMKLIELGLRDSPNVAERPVWLETTFPDAFEHFVSTWSPPRVARTSAYIPNILEGALPELESIGGIRRIESLRDHYAQRNAQAGEAVFPDAEKVAAHESIIANGRSNGLAEGKIGPYDTEISAIDNFLDSRVEEISIVP